MDDEAKQILIAGIKPYPESLRKRHRQRLIRLNDAKKILRLTTELMEAEMPRWWQFAIAGVMEYAGNALLAFAGGLKSAVKKAGILDKIIQWANGAETAIAPLAQRFAAFFGVRTTLGGGIWKSIVSFVQPSPDAITEGAILHTFNVASLNRLAQLIERCTVGGPNHDTIGPFNGEAEKRYALPQRRARRRRKAIRTRRIGKRRAL